MVCRSSIKLPYHTHEYIRREWSRYFEIVAIHPKGIGNHQDAVLVRKRTL